MPRKRTVTTASSPDKFFVKELENETPPSISAMMRLYDLASHLYGLRPWRLLDENRLILVRDSVSGELCYCSVMGMLGEVYSVHVYIGTEGLRLFRRMESEEITSAGEFFDGHHAVSVEYVPRAELEKQDRELLAALGHPQGRGLDAPKFRAIRPGCHPWFVTEEEARTLAECIRAVIVVSAAVAGGESAKFWERANVYPLVSRVEGAEPHYKVDLVEALLPAEPPLPLVQLNEEILRPLRGRDYAVGGVMELDYILSGAPIGRKSERKVCASIALAVDANSGMVLASEMSDSGATAGEALAKAFLRAIQGSRVLPQEVRVRNERLKESIAPLLGSFGVSVGVARRLPAADEAQAYLLSFLQGGVGGR
jgi:hypothetical protein